MPKYRVVLEASAYFYVDVDADDSEQAVEAAFEEAPTICAQCSGWGQPWSIDLGEWDVPQDENGADASYTVEEIG